MQTDSAQFGIKMKQKVDKVGGEAFIEIKGAPEQSQLTSSTSMIRNLSKSQMSQMQV